MRKLLNMLKKNDNCISLGRLLAVIAFFLWVGVTVFSVALNRYWQGYETLTIASIVFLLVQLANKTVESKLFSVKSEVKKNETDSRP